ncbi:MAG: DUF1311 domain-containing protein [Pseudomonadales bacterium]|jgi:uncharacterized protein YecT (DUF1311 family)|nr:DUF1311 domain-containing protein [Pseudomonadales bacterium]
MIKRSLSCAWVAMLLCASPVAFAADCTEGSQNADKCLAQLEELDLQLKQAYQAEEQRVSTLYGKDYGGIEGDGYAKYAIEALRAEADAWRKYRGAKCHYESYLDGMSLNYTGAIAAACEVNETQIRIQQVEARAK